MKFSEMFGSAVWLTPSEACENPYMRAEFEAVTTEKTEIVICGLGWFELYINGRRYGDELFVPPVSDYHYCATQFCHERFGERTGHRIYCKKYDISDYVKDGKNVIGVILGSAWYRYPTKYGTVKVCYKITSGSLTTYSGSDMLWKRSFITGYHIYFGETHDMSLALPDSWSETGFDVSDWLPAAVCDIPKTEYLFTDCPPDRVIRTISPKIIKETESFRIYDAGENISGRAVVTADVAGEKMLFRFAEEIKEDGTLDDLFVHGQKSYFIPVNAGDTFYTRFTWNGFRYFELPLNAHCECVEVIHADVKPLCEFETDSPALNSFYNSFIRTQQMNMHSGIPSDCPHLERLGYTGDGQLVCETGMLLFDSKEFYRKWIYDIADCQDRITGHVQYTAPYAPAGGGPGGWGCAIVEVPYTFYKVYGDIKPAADLFEGMLRWFDFLEAHSENGLIVSDQPGLWCLGDWCTPEKIEIPQPFVNNYFYIKSMKRVLELAEALERDAGFLRERIKAREKAITDKYFNPETGDFCDNIQGSNVFAVDLGLGDERTFDRVVERYTSYGMFDTGIFGTDILLRVLFERDKGDLAVSLLTSDKIFSFSTQLKAGATTLWEEWKQSARSHSHPMFGAPVRYLFAYILGIRFKNGVNAPAEISPVPLTAASGITRASGALRGVRSEITL